MFFALSVYILVHLSGRLLSDNTCKKYTKYLLDKSLGDTDTIHLPDTVFKHSYLSPSVTAPVL